VVNHFSAEAGARAAIEKWLSRYSSSLGWNPEFAKETLLGHADLKLVAERSLQPLGLYTLLVFERA
jgi:phosphatidylethanolamine/phosphatidyl-N-methylethanolamine N-methyltransferase